MALAFATTLITMPVSGADFGTGKALGSVTAIGAVELRGVALTGGNKIELDQRAEVQVAADGQGTRVLLASGNIGFSAAKATPLRLALQPFEIVATDAGGNVAVQSSGTAGIRTTKGKVTVRNLKTAESFVLNQGEERLLMTATGKVTKPQPELPLAVWSSRTTKGMISIV